VFKLGKELDALNADEFAGEEDLWGELEALLNLLRIKLAQADRRVAEVSSDD
jgi:hypothetical protein